MGGFTAFRNHLFNLFPRVFKRRVDSGTLFCLIILDMMQFLAGKVKHTTQTDAFDAEAASRSMRNVVESYMKSDEYRATKAVIALFDTPKSVPTNKARTQKKRDTHTIEEKTKTTTILDETLYTLHSTSQATPSIEIDSLLKWPLTGDTLWRSNNAKFQLYAKLTEELLKIMPDEGLKLIIDDGVAVDHALYLQRRGEMITHYFFSEKSAYEQECLVASLARHHFTERFIVSQEKGVERLAQTGTGEADLKIPRFIVYGNNTSRYLIVSQDTDLIFILLLHLKSLAPFDKNLEVWLDTQTPGDRAMNVSRVYRFINVVALYNAIIELFEEEYPSVKNPIETLVFLCYALETDFTSGFNSALQVTPARIWNTFSALHTDIHRPHLLFNANMHDADSIGVGTKKEASREKDAAKMGIKRSVRTGCPYPEKWWLVLQSAVQYGYDAIHDTYQLVLDDVKCQSFFYLVCQLKLLDELAALGYSQFDNKQDAQRTYITTSDELFIWTAEIETRVNAYRVASPTTETKKRKAQYVMAEQEPVVPVKKSKPLIVLAKRKEPRVSVLALLNEIEEIEEIEEMEEEVQGLSLVKPTLIHQTAKIAKKLADLANKSLPKDYGLPRLDAMLARVYRIEWVMNYHQNGWKTNEYMTNFAQVSPQDASLSLYGWKAREIVQSAESIKRGDFNNSYYTSVFEEGIKPGVIPFRVFEMVETDLVYNRQHTAYLDFGV